MKFQALAREDREVRVVEREGETRREMPGLAEGVSLELSLAVTAAVVAR